MSLLLKRISIWQYDNIAIELFNVFNNTILVRLRQTFSDVPCCN